jgi:hypothetical protein
MLWLTQVSDFEMFFYCALSPWRDIDGNVKLWLIPNAACKNWGFGEILALKSTFIQTILGWYRCVWAASSVILLRNPDQPVRQSEEPGKKFANGTRTLNLTCVSGGGGGGSRNWTSWSHSRTWRRSRATLSVDRFCLRVVSKLQRSNFWGFP